MATGIVTDSMRASAQVLLSRSAVWSKGTRNRDDLNVFVFSSSKPGVVYFTNPIDGTCNCPGYRNRLVCSHAVAVRLQGDAGHRSNREMYTELFGEG